MDGKVATWVGGEEEREGEIWGEAAREEDRKSRARRAPRPTASSMRCCRRAAAA